MHSRHDRRGTVAQRTALLVDGANTDASTKELGLELDYSLLMEYVSNGGPGRVEGGFARGVVVARVYIEARSGSTGKRGRLVDWLRSVGYQVRLCDEGCVSLRMLLDMIVLALTGRVDAMILVWGDGHSISRDFLRGIRTAQAVGIQIETLALDSAPEVLKRVTEFHDLRDTMLLRRVR